MSFYTRRHALRLASTGLLGMYAARGMRATEPHIVVPSYNTLTDEQEVELGRQFASEVEKESQVVSGGMVDSYLTPIIKQLAAKSQRPNLPYQIKLVNSYEVNAFSLAGGFMYVNRGLVEYVDNEDELVAALSHELGHVVGRHCINHLILNFAAKRVLDKVVANLGHNNQVIIQIIRQLGGAMAIIALLHFSREDELQADLLGFYEMLRAGWDPHGFLTLFQKLNDLEKKSGGGGFKYLSSHPPTPQRYQAIQQELPQVQIPRGAKTDSLGFHTFKLSMKMLPEPPKKKDDQKQ